MRLKVLKASSFLFKKRRKISIPQPKSSTENIDAGTKQVEKSDALSQLPDWISAAAPQISNDKQKVIFILDKASLTLAHVGNRYRILNPDQHADFLRKKKLDPYKYRPDIVHEALRQIMSSRLCLAGRLESVYIKTDEGVLIKVDPRANVPESLDDFCGLMSELLQNLSIKAKGKCGKTLFRVVKNPVTQHLPVNCLKIGLSSSSSNVVELRDYVGDVIVSGDNVSNLVFAVGAMARGKIDSEFCDELISISGNHPLSVSFCLSRISIALERRWNIL